MIIFPTISLLPDRLSQSKLPSLPSSLNNKNTLKSLNIYPCSAVWTSKHFKLSQLWSSQSSEKIKWIMTSMKIVWYLDQNHGYLDHQSDRESRFVKMPIMPGARWKDVDWGGSLFIKMQNIMIFCLTIILWLRKQQKTKLGLMPEEQIQFSPKGRRGDKALAIPGHLRWTLWSFPCGRDGAGGSG